MTFVVYKRAYSSSTGDILQRRGRALMGYFADVFCLPGGQYTPKRRSCLGKFIIFQALTYMLIGGSHMIAPKLWASVHAIPDYGDNFAAEGWFRCFGFVVVYIGALYLFGGLSDSKHFALASTFTRPALVPTLMTMCLGLTGKIPLPIAIFYGVADPVLALLTFVFYKTDMHGLPEA